MTAKKIIAIVVTLLVAFVIQSCYDAATVVIENAPVITKTVSFKKDIIPIFNKTCSVAGCHNASGKSPDLSADNAYASLVNGKYFNTKAADQSVLYLYLTGKKSPQMPMGGPYNPSSLNQLTLAWIKQGAKNN